MPSGDASAAAARIPVRLEVGRVALPYRALGTMVYFERERLEGRVGEAGIAAALQLLDDNPGIILLITDIVMPGMDGWALARAARRRNPEIKALYMSGGSPLIFVQRGLTLSLLVAAAALTILSLWLMQATVKRVELAAAEGAELS